MAMQCKDLINAIIAYADAQDLTLQQLAGVSISQVVNVLGLSDAGDVRLLTINWQPIRSSVKGHIIKKGKVAELAALKATAQTWMTANFPNATWSRYKNTITIELEGE